MMSLVFYQNASDRFLESTFGAVSPQCTLGYSALCWWKYFPSLLRFWVSAISLRPPFYICRLNSVLFVFSSGGASLLSWSQSPFAVWSWNLANRNLRVIGEFVELLMLQKAHLHALLRSEEKKKKSADLGSLAILLLFPFPTPFTCSCLPDSLWATFMDEKWGYGLLIRKAGVLLS